ncbi:YadA-like family protein [Proteus mirabilis]|uniref:YadA-like family protein n=1 Tax=Proteus mirabilis TaxID=584 RepID=UPI001F043CB3|nr:YadA-like family protein [Proteus mirabilis]
MNYNKLFIISISLIYSANVFSNTDSPSPMDNLSPSMTFSPPVISPSPLPTGNPSQLVNGSMVESSVGIHPISTTYLPQPPSMGYGAPTIGNTLVYRMKHPDTDTNTIKLFRELKTYFDMTDHAMVDRDKFIGEYFSNIITISSPSTSTSTSTSTSSENIFVMLHNRSFFDDLVEAIEADSNEHGMLLVDKSKKDVARDIFSYLENIEAGFLKTMGDENDTNIELEKMMLLNNIRIFKDIVEESINNDTPFAIFANQEIEKPLTLTEFKKTLEQLSQPATRGEVANAYVSSLRKIDEGVGIIANEQQRTTETLVLQDNKITKVESDVKKNKDNIAVNREDITKVGSIVETNKENITTIRSSITKVQQDVEANKEDIKTNKEDIKTNKEDIQTNKEDIETNKEDIETNKEDIQTNRKDITQVKQTAVENKKHVDKYLVDNFQVSGESRNLINHLGALYLENKSNSLAISSLRNDFEHFKDETNNRFYKVEKRANQGIASVAAMSNLPFNDAATFSTAMGIGNYRNATAFAWGMQYRINENVKVKASTAWNDANNWVSAGGIGISW